jgi:hypothetical protein
MRLVLARPFQFTLLAFVCAAAPVTAAVSDFAYLSPVPGSRMVSPENNVAIRPGVPLEPRSVSPALVSVSGSLSGAHAGRLRLSSDGRTLVFRPDVPFTTGETVRVRLASGLRARTGTALPSLDYSFQVSVARASEMPRRPPDELPEPPQPSAWWNAPEPALTAVSLCDTLLPGFPTLSVVNASAQLPGVYFMAPFENANQSTARLQILDDRGKPLYQRQYSGPFRPVDFKVQADGRMTFWLSGREKFYAMDSAYAVVDSFVCGNGYPTDLHELKILPNGHALLMSYDPQPVDMSAVVPGGNPNAIVFGLIIQELDENRDVVFQWRSWDHFEITDGSPNSPNPVNLTGASIDYCHGNSIDDTPDGNLIISSRHMNEITKIDRQTGDIIWRMGRNAVHNQFSFPNDTRGWADQHDARIQPDGHLTLFDNGNGLSPQYSRALEFQLDETNLIATKVWEYRHTPDVFGGFMGNVQRQADGSTVIGWGGTAGTIKSTDLHSDGSIAAEVQGPGAQVNYRMFRRPWRSNRILAEADDLDVPSPALGAEATRAIKVWNHWNQPIDITCLRTADSDFGAILASGSLPVHLAPGETTTVEVAYHPVVSAPRDSRLYIMQVGADEIVAQTVDLHGRIDATLGAPTTTGAALTASARPNPLQQRTTIEYAVPSAGHVTLDLFDVHGRRVARLVDGERPAGRNSVEWRAPSGRGGLYFYRLQAAGRTLVQKLVVIGT